MLPELKLYANLGGEDFVSSFVGLAFVWGRSVHGFKVRPWSPCCKRLNGKTRTQLRAGRMVWQGKVAAAKSDGLNLIPGTYVVEGENPLLGIIL